MELFLQLVVGGCMIALTVAIQAISLDLIIRRSGRVEKLLRSRVASWKPILASLLVVMVFCVHIVQIWIWALLYLYLDSVHLHTVADALYFSTVTFSTVGFGDIVLSPDIRMLSAIEAANGFLIFGWTTAFIFELISKLYKVETKKI